MRLPVRRSSLCVALLSSALLGACVDLAPAYQRPAAPVAAAWPAAPAASAASAAPGARNADDIGWRDFFLDDRLRRVVDLALANNRDLRIAVATMAQAHATYRVQDAARLPTLSAGASATRARSAGITSDSVSVDLGLASYELDFFGRVKNLGDAALQSYLASAEGARSTRISLVSEVATAWLTLAADDELLALAEQTLASDRRSLELTRRMHDLGAATGLTVAQAEATAESARVTVAADRAQVAQDLDALTLLVGATLPADLLPSTALEGPAAVLVDLPAGVPADVLQRRPDVLQAEHSLRSAQVDIGAARAAFFPAITLTASAGTASTDLSGLFRKGSGAWSFGPSISLPLFDGGARRADLDAAEAARDIALATYEKSVQTAFQEVADALAVRASLAERIAAQEAVTRAGATSLRLADALFRNGGSSYLDVLEAQRTLFASQQAQISLKLAEQGNRITLYKVLGGGWKDST
jgi:multidrug efflux system outer membrane protein